MTTTQSIPATYAPIDMRPAIDRTAADHGWSLTHDTADTNVYQRNDGERVYQATIRFTDTGSIRAAGVSAWIGGAQVGGASIDATGAQRGTMSRLDRFNFALGVLAYDDADAADDAPTCPHCLDRYSNCGPGHRS
jgi:hypothetical protein